MGYWKDEIILNPRKGNEFLCGCRAQINSCPESSNKFMPWIFKKTCPNCDRNRHSWIDTEDFIDQPVTHELILKIHRSNRHSWIDTEDSSIKPSLMNWHWRLHRSNRHSWIDTEDWYWLLCYTQINLCIKPSLMNWYWRLIRSPIKDIVQIRRALESHRVITERKQKTHTIQHLLLKHSQIQESKATKAQKENYKLPRNNII